MVRFVSIGANCQPAHHIQRLTKAAPMFFDWVYSSPEGVSSLIQTGFRDILAPEAIEWGEPRENHPVLWDARHRIEFFHQVDDTSKEGIARLRRVYRALGEVFLRLMEEREPLCFVRFVHDWDGPLAAERTRSLADWLLSRRPNSVFLALDWTDRVTVDGRFIEAFNPHTADWTGDAASYERNLRLAEEVAQKHT